jgi:hypothetical protein
MKERDESLDYLKGIACILMVLAHYPYSPTQVTIISKIVSYIVFIGGTAPVIFFAVSGVTATFQSKKNMISIMIFYIIFALLGLSYNIQWRPALYKDFASDVPQIIAMSVIIISILEKYVKPSKEAYLTLAIAIFCLHYFVTRYIQPFPLKVFLFAPGLFTLIPWLSMFFLGIFAYRARNIINLIAGMISVFIFFILLLLQFKEHTNFLDKLNMSGGYFIVSATIIFLAFYLVRVGNKYFNHRIVRYFGKGSLLFLYVHVFATRIVKEIADFNILISWIIVLLITYIGMLLLGLLNKYIESLFSKLSSWIFMILLICILPFKVSNLNICILTEMILGILFANNYSRILVLINEKSSLIKTFRKDCSSKNSTVVTGK